MWKIIDICRTCRIHPVRRIKKTLRKKNANCEKKTCIFHYSTEFIGCRNYLPSREPRSVLLVSFLCRAFVFICLRSLCLVHPMLTVYLECQFMIAPPVFANGNMYKNPYKYRYIAESVKCSTKSLSKLSTLSNRDSWLLWH